ncbi:hypothetical protein [Streptomyces fractus]|uniref:hypothetical protein n=1 Tax=Streptomyces fractus TaxID=641806 RepID=UPI003CFB1EBA
MTITDSPQGSERGRTAAELEAEIESLRAARKETATVAEERDVVRKATKFFAQEMSW